MWWHCRRGDAYAGGVRTLHVGIRVTDLDRSLAFYRALGYRVIGSVPGTGIGDLTMLALPEDRFVTLELVHAPGEQVTVGGINHVVVQVESMAAIVKSLASQGTDVENTTVHDPASGFTTAWLTDPDGYRIELVQWPEGHADGMTADDFMDTAGTGEEVSH